MTVGGMGFIPERLLMMMMMNIAFVVGGLGFEFCVFVAGWRHALRSEWPFIIIIIIMKNKERKLLSAVAVLGATHNMPLLRHVLPSSPDGVMSGSRETSNHLNYLM